MTDAQCARSLAAIYPHMQPTADRMLALIAEVERLRAIEAAGERLATEAASCRDTLATHFHRDSAIRLSAALDAWEAARRAEPTP